MPDVPVQLPRAGSYEPLLEIAAGGMGVVYLARKTGDAGFERLVVLKRIHTRLLQDAQFHDMLRDEARLASLVTHPNVVPVIDVVMAHGELSLVFDYVESLSLSALLSKAKKQGARLPAPVVARILGDALAGLHGAHEAVDLAGNALDMVHRDVSPQNIIVGLDGRSRLIDFGIAKAKARRTDTTTGVVKGKLRYMSPEQAKLLPLDRRADVYAAGVVLFEAMTGERMCPAEDEGDLLLSILLGEARVPTEVDPSLPWELDHVVARATARDRDDRFATAGELEEALEAVVPLAPAREVARYVEQFGGPELEERRAKLRAMARDRGSRRADETDPRSLQTSPAETTTALDLAAPAGSDVVTRVEQVADVAPPRPRQSPWLVVTTLVAVALAAMSMVIALRSTTTAIGASPSAPSAPALSERTTSSPSASALTPFPSASASGAPSAAAPGEPELVSMDALPNASAPRAAPKTATPPATSELHGNPYHP